jgi:predicted SnoaL-like aldol condensation-catalyzing enzyme
MSNISSSTIPKTTEQENELLARRFHMEIFQKGKFDLADEILTPDFVLHNPILPLELIKGPEGVKRFASGVVDSCPGHQFTHHETISKGDKVLIRWTFTGIA